MDISTANDIKELKALKADQYDLLEAAQQQIERSRQNILALNTRLTQLQDGATPETPATDGAPATEPAHAE